MSASARVSRAKLLSEGAVERIPVDAEVCGNLLRQSANHLRTAVAGVTGDDSEGAFQLAYDACRKACLSLVIATGLRPKGDAAHAVTFEAAAAIAANFGSRRLVADAGELRYVRHGAEYRAETVTAEDTNEAIEIGRELLAELTPRIEQILQSAG